MLREGIGRDENVLYIFVFGDERVWSRQDHARQLHDIHVLLWTSNIHVFVSEPLSLFLSSQEDLLK